MLEICGSALSTLQSHRTVIKCIDEQVGRRTTSLRHNYNTTPDFTTTGDGHGNYSKGLLVGRNSIRERMFTTVTVTDRWEPCPHTVPSKRRYAPDTDYQ